MYKLILKVDPDVSNATVYVTRGVMKNDTFIPENGWVFENLNSVNGRININLDPLSFKNNNHMSDILKPGDTLRIEYPEGTYHYIDDMIDLDITKNNQYISSNNIAVAPNVISKVLRDSDSIEVSFAGTVSGYLEIVEISDKDTKEFVVKRLLKKVDAATRIDTQIAGMHPNNVVYIRWRDTNSTKYTQFIKAISADEEGEVYIREHIVGPESIKLVALNRNTNGPIFDSGLYIKARIGTREITINPNTMYTASSTELSIVGDELAKLLIYNETIDFTVHSYNSTIISNRYSIDFSSIVSRVGILDLKPAETSITETSMKLAFTREAPIDYINIDKIEIPGTNLQVNYTQIPISTGEIMNDTKFIVNIKDVSLVSQELLATAHITYSYKEPGKLRFIAKAALDPNVPDLPNAALEYKDDGVLILRPNHNLTLYTGQSVEYKHITAYKGHTAIYRSMVNVEDSDNEVILHDITADVGPITDVKFRWTFAGRPFSALQSVSLGNKYTEYINNIVAPKMAAFKPRYDYGNSTIFVDIGSVPLPTDIIIKHISKSDSSELNTFRSSSQNPRNRSYTFEANALNVLGNNYGQAAKMKIIFVYGTIQLDADELDN